MLTIPVVPICPYTTSGVGTLKLSHAVLGTLAGAVYDRIEWMALLIGKRDKSGLNVTVESLRIPLQTRSHGNCSMVRQEPLASDVIGVVHSHHSMGAFFSQTDDDTLNPRFPTSIVIAQVNGNTSEVESLLGFRYKAEGRVQLSCGSMGIINFVVQPDPLLDIWPEKVEGHFDKPNLTTTLSHCPHNQKKRIGLRYECSTKCGIHTQEQATAIFGRDGKEFLTEVEKQTKASPHIGQQMWVNDKRHYKNYGLRTIDEYPYDDERYLKHWGI